LSTSEGGKKRGWKELFNAYFSLELVISIYSSKIFIFIGNADFKKIMFRDRLIEIHTLGDVKKCVIFGMVFQVFVWSSEMN
jgi:hypothetical protein